MTRRKYSPEEKIRIVLEGIKPHSYYSWTKEFMEAGKERLSRDTVRDSTRQQVEQLKRENGELKQLVADLSLEAYRLKKTAIPMPPVSADERHGEGRPTYRSCLISAPQEKGPQTDGHPKEHLLPVAQTPGPSRRR